MQDVDCQAVDCQAVDCQAVDCQDVDGGSPHSPAVCRITTAAAEATARHNLIQCAIAALATREDLNEVMALIDFHYHLDDTPTAWNTRLRQNVKQCYNKIGLSAADREEFAQWDLALEALPARDNDTDATAAASRLQIFALASDQCLSIVGL